MSHYIQEPILDRLPVELVFKLYLTSKSMMKVCGGYLQNKARIQLKDPTIVINSVQDYIRELSNRTNYVWRSSQAYIGLDEAVYRASMIGDMRLIRYFIRVSKSSRSRLTKLAILSSLVAGYSGNSVKLLRNIHDSKLLNALAVLSVKYGGPFLRSTGPPYTISGVISYAASHGYLPLIKRLIHDGHSYTDEAFIAALRGCHEDVINYLLGGKINMRYVTEEVSAAGNLKAVEYILDHKMAHPDDVLYNAAIAKNIPVMRLAQSRGAKENMKIYEDARDIHDDQEVLHALLFP